jgi:adenosylcobinamide kinase/adenosylcobinamide-phosphate guanylyltransferase
MHPTILITGGSRSGKSGYALALGEKLGGQNNIFIATCVPSDEEMQKRVQRHKLERGPHWHTIEEPLDLPKAIDQAGAHAEVMLIDCLTLWVSNLMAAHEDDDLLLDKVQMLCSALDSPPCPIVLVTNEVGAGIVPENPLVRRFRDLAGWTNQLVAAACRQVFWMVAGIAVPVKPQESSFQNLRHSE